MPKLEIQKEKIEKLCKKHNVKLLILHGSYAKGTATGKSDIDVGILFKDAPKVGYFKIIGDFGELFGDNFDPAFLNGTEPMINYQVALNGKVLYEDQKGDFNNYKIGSIAKYMDTKKFRELEKLYIKRAIGRN
ncbi:hypothetical protein A2310_07090 [candidate division WOR-1 bacterium RIFOXYB2_FULL_37_13]|uniref:Polymerase beta nucleotidyltransferase domain-containing protein n=1 Tax=candidate division WOR-1 bacterium RIFOXYB2_FULL_37_13 TaxID=1802579 RepID=A0A1F4SNP4_UNCSA|nr:MAG: hypothetical protein A2310_07090 [candidate division WOR-1 bacterium RIFOXYB2_FULL_37_13]